MTTPRPNRIIDHRVVKGRDLLPNPGNWRTHPPQQREATRAALDRLGYVDELKVVQTPDGLLLLDGHMRAEIGEDDDIPVAVVDLDEEEQRIMLATFDPITSMAYADLDAYARLEVASDDEGLQALIDAVQNDEYLPILADDQYTTRGREPKEETFETGNALTTVEADDYEPTSKRGQVFALGDHRLMCGDATNAEDVTQVTDGDKPQMVLTDPPYCSGGFQEAGKKQGSVGTRGEEMITNDVLSTRGYIALMSRVLGNSGAGLVYVFTDWRMWVTLFDVTESNGYGVRAMVVWDKGSPGMGRGWRSQHELILCGSKVTQPFDPHKAQGNVIQAKRTGNIQHATEKPVDLIVTILEVSDICETVYDPFVGSGTTIIAAEKLGRRCYAMEIEPRYVDVAIRRWEDFTGQKAVLLESPRETASDHAPGPLQPS